MPLLAPGLLLAWIASAAPCEDARRLHEALSPERALDLAEQTLSTDATRPLACLEVRALALLVLGRSEDARGVFAELFTRDPDRRIDDPSLSPPMWLLIEAVRESSRPLLARVSARWLDPTRLALQVGLVGGLRGARAVRWRAVANPAGPVFEGKMALVGRSASATVTVGSEVSLASFAVSGAVLAAGDVEIAQLAAEIMLGSRPVPPIVADAEEGTRWWLWGGILVVVAATATTIGLVASSQPVLPDTTGTIGRVDLDR